MGSRVSTTLLTLLAVCWSTAAAPAADPPVDFETQIAPIFENHCVRCHTPGNAKGDLSLATIEDLRENEYLVLGDPDASYLVDLISSVDGQPAEMPKESDPLSLEQVTLIRRWIAEGGAWPEDVIVRQKSKADSSWWSLQPLKTTRHVRSSDPDAPGREIGTDDFIRNKLSENGLTLNPPADRRTLIRRATYDLLGLPPTPEEVQTFVDDPDPQAYEKLVRRLLRSPHYGERWGRHWLDVVRFGESNGFERNVIINELWPFRDYVIRSINQDKPFDLFIREHIAGDVLEKDNPDVAVGSAFLVAGPYDDVGNQDPAQAAQIRANTLDEMISATGQAFLGLTVGCARCHDHKFDPITQRDYYGLYATFAGIRHGAVPLGTSETKAQRTAKLKPLNEKKGELEKSLVELKTKVLQRAQTRLAEYEAAWRRPSVDRTGTEEQFEPVTAKFVRLVCEAQDINPSVATGFRIDEFEIWSDENNPQNVALAAAGAKAFGKARQIEDFPGAYGPQLAIDGKTGARFISTGTDLTVELAQPTRINRVVFSSAKGEEAPQHAKFVFVADYRIEVSGDGEAWREVAHGRDRKPISQEPRTSRDAVMKPIHVDHRLLEMEISTEERAEQTRLHQELAAVKREIAQVPDLPSVWIGTRVASDAEGPFHVFLGGSPQKKGEEVVPASLSVLTDTAPSYQLAGESNEEARRLELAKWLTHPDNPLTARVLANRIWHYHFGTGIVDTPSDFGYMGGRPTHPDLLDFLAIKLQENGWRLNAMHFMIMTSQTYRQSSEFRASAAQLDGDSRLLWRFPPRRLSAEEVRDTMLQVTGKLNTKPGGPGFRLYRFMQDNVCTYVPLDSHGSDTYRRAVYHQNARASIVDLMTEFDQPDCAFSTPRRAETTTPLQALTMLNHSFTFDMADYMAERLEREAPEELSAQIRRAYQLCYARPPTEEEANISSELVSQHSLSALCRVLLNTSEMIYVR